MSYYGSPGSLGGRKRGRDYDDDSSSNYGNTGKQRRFDIDQALPDRPYRQFSQRGRGGRGSYGGNNYQGNGAGRRNDRDLIPLLSVGEKYCVNLWRLGDELTNATTEESSRFTTLSADDIEGLKNETCNVWSKGSRDEVLRGFRIATSELPHKLPFIAILLGLLASQSITPPPSRIAAKPLVTLTGSETGPLHINNGGEQNDEDEEMQAATTTVPAIPQNINIGVEIVKDLVKAFQNHLDTRRWRSVRFSLHLFAHLASLPKPLISTSSLLDLLHQSFVTVLNNEPGLRTERGDELVRVVLETLMRLRGQDKSGETLEGISNGIKVYMASRKLDIDFLGGDTGNVAQFRDPVNDLFQAFLDTNDSLTANLVKIQEMFPSIHTTSEHVVPLQLPIISLPPETELDLPLGRTATVTDAADHVGDQEGYTGVRATLSFFVDNTVPPHNTNAGVFLRQLVTDVINVYEVNRRECARILLTDLPKWVPRDTFKSADHSKVAGAASTNGDTAPDSDNSEGSELVLENLVMDSILSALFSTPSSSSRAVYYHSLVGELCKISPQTVAPALGKCIRKMYSGLGQTENMGESDIVLGPEGIRRYAEWFAVHLSNFGFHWRWPEWEGDLFLPAGHPKKVFIARVLELEVRLSYFDRIKLTIPDTYLTDSDGIFPSAAPGPSFTYESEGPSLYQAPAAELLKIMRSRGTIDEVKEQLETYKKEFMEGEIGDPIDEGGADRVIRDITFQSILVIGSRSFSHFLNILERYITLIREFTKSAGARLELLQSISRFWAHNSQFLMIVFDKLLQYRVVDPIDVVSWVFAGEQAIVMGDNAPRDWTNFTTWDVLRMTLEKVQTRVAGATARLEALRKKEENRVDAERAARAELVETAEDIVTTAPAEVETVERQLSSVTREQEALIVEIVRQFNDFFLTMDTGKDDSWSIWFAKGWWAEFCRAFAKCLSTCLDALAVVDLPSDGIVYQGLQSAHIWIDSA